MKNILIIGADSNIGRYLNFFLKRNFPFIKIFNTSRRKYTNNTFLDLEYPENFIVPEHVEFAFFLSYLGGISFARENKDETYNINVTNTKKILQTLKSNNIHLIYPSSNLLLNSKKNIEYISQKKEIEDYIENTYEKSIIVKSGKIIHPNFLLFDSWALKIKQNKKIYAFDDMYISPNWIFDYLELVCRLCESRFTGKILFTSNGKISYYNVAIMIANSIKDDGQNLVLPVNSTTMIHADDIADALTVSDKDFNNKYICDLNFRAEEVISKYLKYKNEHD